MSAQITVTSKEMTGKRLYLLFIEDADEEKVKDIILASEKPQDSGSEWYKPVSEMQLSGIFNGRESVTLSFDDNGQLVSIQ